MSEFFPSPKLFSKPHWFVLVVLQVVLKWGFLWGFWMLIYEPKSEGMILLLISTNWHSLLKRQALFRSPTSWKLKMLLPMQGKHRYKLGLLCSRLRWAMTKSCMKGTLQHPKQMKLDQELQLWLPWRQVCPKELLMISKFCFDSESDFLGGMFIPNWYISI